MTPRDYTLAGIIVDGVVHLDHDLIIQKSELVRGEKISIPGEKLSTAIANLWEQGFF
jgi:outer membrane protein insertion porin family